MCVSQVKYVSCVVYVMHGESACLTWLPSLCWLQVFDLVVIFEQLLSIENSLGEE